MLKLVLDFRVELERCSYIIAKHYPLNLSCHSIHYKYILPIVTLLFSTNIKATGCSNMQFFSFTLCIAMKVHVSVDATAANAKSFDCTSPSAFVSILPLLVQKPAASTGTTLKPGVTVSLGS
jgi:hypothetical protein